VEQGNAHGESYVVVVERGQETMSNAYTISRALNGVPSGNGYVCRCPVPGHGKGKGDRARSLSVCDSGGRVLFKCFAECDAKDIIEELRRMGLWSSSGTGDAKAAKNKSFALNIWRNSVAASGTLVETYLQARAITIPPPASLRFHAALAHKPSGKMFPTMVALVTCDKEILGIHRTYLKPDGCGKADIETPKMLLVSCKGGAVRLGPVAETVRITEGIETALSVMQFVGGSVWAAISQGGMRDIVLPPEVKQVILCADGDEVGIQAATDAYRRFRIEGRSVRIARPPRGKDFNDLLCEEVRA
jgi:putative DNA primase/helicase